MELEVNYIERHLSGWDRSDYIHLTGRPISEVYAMLCARGHFATDDPRARARVLAAQRDMAAGPAPGDPARRPPG